MLTLPESPKFLLDNGHVEAARRVLRLTLGIEVVARKGSSEGGDEDAVLDEMIRGIQLLDRSCHHQPCEDVEDSDCDRCDDTEDAHIDASSNNNSSSGRDIKHNNAKGEEEEKEEKEPSYVSNGFGLTPPLPGRRGAIRNQVTRMRRKASPSAAYSKLPSPDAAADDDNDDESDGGGVEGGDVEGGGAAVKRSGAGGAWESFWEYRTPLAIILALMVFQQFTGAVQCSAF
jgi:hypothetical protein